MSSSNVNAKWIHLLTYLFSIIYWELVIYQVLDLPFFFLFLCLFIFERQSTSRGRGRERGRHRIRNRLQTLSCQHRAWRGARTHGLWDHDLSWSQMLNRLSHPGAPGRTFLDYTHAKWRQSIVRTKSIPVCSWSEAMTATWPSATPCATVCSWVPVAVLSYIPGLGWWLSWEW